MTTGRRDRYRQQLIEARASGSEEAPVRESTGRRSALEVVIGSSWRGRDTGEATGREDVSGARGRSHAWDGVEVLEGTGTGTCKCAGKGQVVPGGDEHEDDADDEFEDEADDYERVYADEYDDDGEDEDYEYRESRRGPSRSRVTESRARDARLTVRVRMREGAPRVAKRFASPRSLRVFLDHASAVTGGEVQVEFKTKDLPRVRAVLGESTEFVQGEPVGRAARTLREGKMSPFKRRKSIGPGPRKQKLSASGRYKCQCRNYTCFCRVKGGGLKVVKINPATKAAYNQVYRAWVLKRDKKAKAKAKRGR